MINISPHQADYFFRRQLGLWPLAAENYFRLAEVRRKPLTIGNYRFGAMFNPARIVSTGAKMDAATLKKRPCFLCDANRPAEQKFLPIGDGYRLLVNPFPIFDQHFTIVGSEHEPQSVAGRIGDMLHIANALERFTVFYNGPRCGASAPDHFHFQAAPSFNFPYLQDCLTDKQLLLTDGTATLSVVKNAPLRSFVIEGADIKVITRLFERLELALPWMTDDTEPMMNILCSKLDNRLQLIVIPRSHHRPECYGTERGQLLVSPASVDLTGWIITPLEKDFNALDVNKMQMIFDQTCLSAAEVDSICARLLSEPTIDVGIYARPKVCANFVGVFMSEGMAVEGYQTFVCEDNKIIWNDEIYDELTFSPANVHSHFSLADVTIGVNFHWECGETQTFEGTLRLVVEDGKIVAINHIGIEAYLRSVVSSEMNAAAPLEFLKAHAVISRSWVLSQIYRKVRKSGGCVGELTDSEIVRWYDRDDHRLFDVCADDHCQRYQGLARQTTRTAAAAVEATKGQMLVAPDGSMVDARFSKCCGGVVEEFENCWEPVHHECLASLVDGPHPQSVPDLTNELEAGKWIESSPDVFCNTQDESLLRTILNSYDCDTPDFFRWTVSYSPDQLHDIILQKSGIDFGEILEIKALTRGRSGRAVRLLIRGSLCEKIIGKELEIRKWLSPTHLYSSAITISRGTSGEFVIHGAGWGHGVGLCQIGAAVMGAKGYSYDAILSHYFPDSQLITMY